MRLSLAIIAAALLLAGCALDMNGLGPAQTQDVVQDDAGSGDLGDAGAKPSPPASIAPSKPSLLTDAATSLYGLDQNAAQLACQPTCKGCCDRAGVCHAGNEAAMCGQTGLACVDCAAGDFTCDSAGFCDSDGDQ